MLQDQTTTDLKAMLQTASNKAATAEGLVVQTQEQNRLCLLRMQESTDKLQVETKRCAELQDVNAQLNKEFGDFEEMAKELMALRNAYEKQSADWREVQQRTTEQEAKVAALQSAETTFRANAVAAASKITQLEEAKAQLTAENTSLEQALKAMDSKLTGRDRTHSSAIGACHAREREIESKYASLLKETEALREGADEAASTQTELTRALAEAVEQKNAAARSASALTSRVQAVEDESALSAAKLTALMEDMRQTTSERDVARTSLQATLSRCNDLQQTQVLLQEQLRDRDTALAEV